MVAVFIIMFGLNRLYPTYIDDWDYSFIYYTNDKFTSIFDVIPSMMKHYTMWGGRLVVHTILQEFLYFGPFWADLFNTLMFVTYIFLLYSFSNKNNKVRPAIIFAIFLLTWFFQADLGETVLWMTGSANYLWGTTIILGFLYPYYSYFTDNIYKREDFNQKNKGVIYSILFLLFGIISGWTNENMVVAIGCMLVIFLFYIWKKNRKIDKWAICGFLGFCIGGILMLIAPGNFKRYKQELGLRGITDGKPTLDYYLENLQTLLDGIYQYLLIVIAIYALLLIIYLFASNSKYKREKLVISLLFFGAAFIATFAMIASPVFMPRTWFGITTLLIISVSIILANLDFSKLYINIPVWVCILLGCIMFIKTYTEGRNELVKIRAIVDEREAEVNRQKAEGKEDIVLEIERFTKRDDLIIPKMYDFPEDPDHWMFRAYAHYHEVKSVRVIRKK